MTKLFRNLTVLALAGVVVSSLSGCTDEEIGTAAVIAGGAIIIGSDHHRHDGWDHGDWDRDHGWGRGDDRGPYIPHGGNWHGHHYSLTLDSSAIATAPEFKSTDARVIHVAQEYGISDYAATYVVRAILLAQNKDVSGITDLGLTVSDFKTVMDGEKLSNAKIETLAAKLNMSTAATDRLVDQMTADIQAARE